MRPADVDLWVCLAAACHHDADDDGAARALESALELDPDHLEARLNLGHIRQAQGNWEAAADAFRCVLTADPGNDSVRHLLAAVSGRKASAAPVAHVRDTFDRLSADYDRHLVEVLDYRVPRLLADLLRSAFADPGPFSNALDLGCGTGISGVAFHPLANRLVGVDLSPGMIDRARATGLYEGLETAEIVSFLEQTRERFDLVIAADVFTYLGDLAAVFGRLSNRMTPGGVFLFSTEASESADDWQLRPSGRFAHRREYIQTLGVAHGFRTLAWRRDRLRRERGEWVRGYVFLLVRESG
jgi:predicted TPR repeat methyltransferase